jgi:hypothetical protein
VAHHAPRTSFTPDQPSRPLPPPATTHSTALLPLSWMYHRSSHCRLSLFITIRSIGVFLYWCNVHWCRWLLLRIQLLQAITGQMIAMMADVFSWIWRVDGHRNGCNCGCARSIRSTTQPHHTRNRRLSSAVRPTAVALTIGLRSGTTNTFPCATTKPDCRNWS